jgi:hypothetical protein
MNRFLLALTSAAALWIGACGGGSGTTIMPPPPQGKYSAASLNGTYAFVTNGEVVTSNSAETSLARTGSFIANGMGGITGGIEDVTAPGATPSLAVPITGGSYNVNADGTGSITLNVNAGGGPSSLTFGITLTSTSGGLMIDETFNSTQASTASGNFILQSAAVCSNPVGAVSGTYVFDFFGVDATPSPESLIGEFSVSNGVITTAFEDQNDAGSLTSGAIVGNFTADNTPPASSTSCGRGIATIGGLNYEFYVVDATRIRFISRDTGPMLTGDAVIQTNTIPTTIASLNSGFAFLVAGSDANGAILTRIGRFTANGTAVANVLMDTNDNTQFTQTNSGSNASIALDAVHLGRGTVTFLGNNQSANLPPYSFVFYLSSATQGVIQETTGANNLAIDVADGTIGAQTGNPFSGSNIAGTYAMNWSGLSVQNSIQEEEDLVGQATIASLGLAGTADIFQFNSVFHNGTGPQTGNVVSGAITIGGDGTGGDTNRNTMAVTLTKNGSATVNFVVYFVNPQLAFFANSKSTSSDVVAGILQMQQ